MDTLTRRRVFLLAFTASGLLAALLGLRIDERLRLWAYLHLAPSICLVQLVALGALLGGCAWCARARWKPDSAALIDGCVAVALAALVVWSVPAELRVESDESNLLATSFGLLHGGQPEAFQTGIYDPAGVLQPHTAKLDKRGMLFPMLLVPLHRAFGYDVQNSLRLNVVVGGLCLWLLIGLARPWAGSWAARSAAGLLVATPAFALAMRSGGFDLANLAALFGLLLATRQALLDSRPAMGWIAVLAAALLAQLRYESILPASAAILILVLALIRSRPTDPAASLTARAWPLAIGPLLLLPALWRQAVPVDFEIFLPWVRPFSIYNAGDNFRGLLVWLLVPDSRHQGLALLGWLFLLACFQWLLGVLRKKPAMPAIGVWWPMHLALAACLCITLVFWWGQAMLTATARYFIPVAALLAVVGARAVLAMGPRSGRFMVVLLPLLALAWRLPAAASGNDLVEMKESLRVQRVESSLRLHAPQCRVLIIDPRAGEFVVRGWSSITDSDARDRWSQIEQSMLDGALQRVVATGLDAPTLGVASANDPGWTAFPASSDGEAQLWWWNTRQQGPCAGPIAPPSGIDPNFRQSALRNYPR